MSTQADFVIRNPSGLHARPASLFVRTAAGFDADVNVTNVDGDPARAVDGKSILAVLSLGVSCGHRIRINVDGIDERAAMAAIEHVVLSGLGETVSQDM
jgi:phosphotransferase system HPr (HPr) family protein